MEVFLFQGFSGRMTVLCLSEERYPSRDIEGVIRGRARQGRIKLGKTGICALDTTNTERGIYSFTRNQWKQDSYLSLKYGTQTPKLLIHFWKYLAFANHLGYGWVYLWQEPTRWIFLYTCLLFFIFDGTVLGKKFFYYQMTYSIESLKETQRLGEEAGWRETKKMPLCYIYQRPLQYFWISWLCSPKA